VPVISLISRLMRNALGRAWCLAVRANTPFETVLSIEALRAFDCGCDGQISHSFRRVSETDVGESMKAAPASMGVEMLTSPAPAAKLEMAAIAAGPLCSRNQTALVCKSDLIRRHSGTRSISAILVDVES
jgi:hypothetical protein